MKTSKGKVSFAGVKNSNKIFGIVIEVILVVALIPIIKTFVAGAENLTATETTVLGLLTLFIVLALVYNAVKTLGLGGKSN